MKLRAVIGVFLQFVPFMLISQSEQELEHRFTPELMTRFEYLKGYRSLPEKDDLGAFVSQRTRLKYTLDHKKFSIVIHPQDVRVWGAVNHLTPDTSGSLSLAEGYGIIKLNKYIQIRIGKQIIQYDQQRIIGSLDWAMQSRRHDLFLFQHRNDSILSFDAGIAWNQDRPNSISTVYNLKKNYKTLQFFHFFRKWDDFQLSLLFLNTGFEFFRPVATDKIKTRTRFNQTTGIHAEMYPGRFTLMAWFYYQSGYHLTDHDQIEDPQPLRAVNAALNVRFNYNAYLNFTLGNEFISGQTQKPDQQRTTAFNPLFGTNHRFNGYMDYFYVNNHINSVGLNDAYFKASYTGNNYELRFDLHYFSSAVRPADPAIQDRYESINPGLGWESDLSFLFKILNGVSLQAGYSRMFGSETLRAIQGETRGTTGDWAYAMILIRPETLWPKTGLF